MIKNLAEGFLYERLPEAVLSFDERGLVWAVIGGVQDRLEDLRSYGRNLSYFFDASGALPQTGSNAVLVDLQSQQGVLYTRSLDILSDTPPDGTTALTTWAAQQLNLDPALLLSVRYGVDMLRLVDMDTLGYLADSIGAVLYQSTLIPAAGEATARQKLISTYFPRLKVKGTAQSFESLGKALGFDDVLMKPLWSRVSPRVPNDVGSPANDPDYASEPEFVPQQNTGPFYDPLETRDGPFYTWVGTAVNGTASTQFYTTAINGFSPFITVTLLGSIAGTNTPSIVNGTAAHPASGSYALANGEPYTRAYVEPEGSSVRFSAIVQGAAFNGLLVNVQTTGTVAVLTITDRLSSLKYRSSFFDLGMTAEMDKVEEIYGAPSVKPNTDLLAGTNTLDGPAVAPYLPWVSGSIAGSLTTTDWLTSVDSNGSHLVIPRHEAAATDRQLNYTALVGAGVQVLQALEEVRPATRQPRFSATGFLLKDTVPYACYGTQTALFTVGAPLTYSGSDTAHPLGLFTGQIAVSSGGSLVVAEDAIDPASGTIWHYLTSTGLSGSYDFSAGSYYFNTTGALAPGSIVYVIYAIDPADTEIIRPEPSFIAKFNGQTACLPRPEDELGDELDEVFDEFPWRRDIVGGGEVVEIAAYAPIANDVGVDSVSDDVVFSDQSGADVNIYVIKSSVTPRFRFTVQNRDTDSTYTPGLTAVAYSGTFKDISTLTAAERDLVNVYTDFETLMEPGYAVYHAGVAQGVPVADLPKFYGPHHRDHIVGWLPFNEHAEDDLKVTDQAYGITSYLYGVTFTDRLWSDERGWYLQMRPNCSLVSTSERDIADDATLSFWLNLGAGTGGTTTIVDYGVLSFDLNEAAGIVTGYVQLSNGVRSALGSFLCSGWTFFYLRKSATSASFGAGDLSTPVTDLNAIAPFDSGNEVLTVRGASGRNFGIHDLRIWNSQKSEADMDLVRYHAPKPTVVNYPMAYVYSANRQDRYGLRVLPNGWLMPDVMPAWVRVPKLGLVRRYDSMGSYSGESRFKEVGLGGGRSLPSSYLLGNSYSIITATGTQVAAGSQGAMPGVNALWLNDTVAGSYVFSGSTPLSNFVLDLSLNLPVITNNTSGVAYSPVTDTLFMINNGNSDIFEFTTSGAHLRTITTDLTDAESICWMHGSYFAVVEERVADIVIWEIVPSTTVLLKTGGTVILPDFVPPGGYPLNDGLEGISYDVVNDVFYVARERSATGLSRSGMRVYRVDMAGTSTQPFYAPDVLPSVVTDISDVFYDFYTDHLYLLHDVEKAITDIDLNGNVQQFVGYPAGMAQPEGMTFNADRTIMWIVGEATEFRRYTKTVLLNSGTASPWPNTMAETNPCREAIWVKGQDGYVWEVTLDGTNSVRELKAERIFRTRSDAEISITAMYDALLSTGTYYTVTDTGWISGSGSNPATITVVDGLGTVVNSVNLNSLVWSEQPTGAQVLLSANGTYLTVTAVGSVMQAVGTYSDTPPLFLYQNSGIVAYSVAGTGAASVMTSWTDRGNTALDQNVDVTSMPSVVSNGTLNVPARGNVGEIAFLNQNSVLPSGVYRLKVESGNIGRVDSDFTGFQVEVTVNALVLQERLLRNLSGFNIRGTDEFEFELEDDFVGDWFLSFFWSNPYSNANTGTQRQLAIYSYELRRLATDLFRVDIDLASSTPTLTLLSTSSYTPATPGGWLTALNSYGTLSSATHESVVFPSNDTIASKHPLSDLLTANTAERREDILLPVTDVLLSDEPAVVFGPVGTLTEPYYNEPLWLLSGGITPNPSVVIAAKMRHDSSQVRVAVSTDLSFSDPIYSETKAASLTDNNLVLKWRVPGLQANGSYFYAVESDGSLYTTSTGTFRTWGTGAVDFNFGVGSCERNLNNGSGGVVSGNPIWDVCRAGDLHFFLHVGDLDYWNNATDSRVPYQTSYDYIFAEAAHRQMFLEVPLFYMYDDHDYGPNDSDRTTPGRGACLSVYRDVVPHPQLPAGAGTAPTYYTFRVGRCQFIVTDLRSMRDPNSTVDGGSKTMMGTAQKAWWKQQVLQANADPDIGAIFWVTTVGFTGATTASEDSWKGFATERTELCDFLKANNVTRLFLIHGDEHCMTIDDGRYSDGATGVTISAGTGAGWPVFGCSPLQQGGGFKNGARFLGPSPHTGGPTCNYYGHVAVRDDGTNVNVGFTALGFNGTIVTEEAAPFREIRWSFNGTESPRP